MSDAYIETLCILVDSYDGLRAKPLAYIADNDAAEEVLNYYSVSEIFTEFDDSDGDRIDDFIPEHYREGMLVWCSVHLIVPDQDSTDEGVELHDVHWDALSVETRPLPKGGGIRDDWRDV